MSDSLASASAAAADTTPTAEELTMALVIGERIGKGQSASIYKARMSCGTEVAVKMAKIECASNLAAEARFIGRCEHPFVIRVLHQEGLMMVMELCDESLDAFIKRLPRGSLFEREKVALPLFAQLVLGVARIHEEGIIHRDLKPSNVFLKNGEVRIGDFEFAELEEEPTNIRKGTPYYMAPEIVEDYEHDRSADIWALGCILFEIIMGDMMFLRATSHDQLAEIQRSPYPLAPVLTVYVQDLIRRLTAYNKAERIAIADVLCHPAVAPFVCRLAEHKPEVLRGITVTAEQIRQGSLRTDLEPLPRPPPLAQTAPQRAPQENYDLVWVPAAQFAPVPTRTSPTEREISRRIDFILAKTK